MSQTTPAPEPICSLHVSDHSCPRAHLLTACLRSFLPQSPTVHCMFQIVLAPKPDFSLLVSDFSRPKGRLCTLRLRFPNTHSQPLRLFLAQTPTVPYMSQIVPVRVRALVSRTMRDSQQQRHRAVVSCVSLSRDGSHNEHIKRIVQAPEVSELCDQCHK
ncbi:hypothetical protein J6590_039576 [Homalodisca vitripennis]|nr:hypothetical protein J6590_039576 [Homalodisca vitripennis]